jgi:2-dehydropantoate 2-reductase
MRILVVGAGATGGYFGARLAAAGRDVTFLVRPKRAEQLRAGGLQILSPNGDLTFEPKLVTAGEITSPYDVVLLTLKAYALEAAFDDMAPAIGPATMVLPILNGMRHLDMLVVRFGGACVLGGTARISTTLDDLGRIHQLTEVQELSYGEISGERSARIVALDETLSGAGFTNRLSQAIVTEMWQKWILLASLGALNCLLRGNIGQIAAAENGRQMATRMLSEAINAAENYSGRIRSTEFLDAARAFLTDGTSQVTSSMYRDMIAGLPTEADHILGDFLLRAESYGVDAPLLTAATVQLRIYEALRAKAATG